MKKNNINKTEARARTVNEGTPSVAVRDVPKAEPQGRADGEDTRQELTLNKRLLLATGAVAILIVGVVVALGSFGGTTVVDNSANNTLTQEEAEKEIEDLLTRVGKHILLPEGEMPLVATVIDASALVAEQPFYSGAQDNDRLIIYGEALKAIIYSPERDIVINVGPIQFSQAAEEEVSQDIIDDGVVAE